MGKTRKLRSSMKALQDALTSFRPAVGAPMCIQPTKTHSFRDDLVSNFNPVYYAPPTSSPFFWDPCIHRSLVYCPQSLPAAESRPIHKSEGEEEEAISISFTTASSSPCRSCLASPSLAMATATLDDVNEAEAKAEAFPIGVISSQRFFFSPSTSKSIMGGSFLEMGSKEMEPLRGDSRAELQVTRGEHKEWDDVFDILLERQIDIITDGATTTRISSLYRESIPMAFASREPYKDFRSSMEEMVAAHGLRDWPDLQQLLHCYLQLNEKKTHKSIVLAFIDLLMHLASASEGKLHGSAVHSAVSTPTFPSPPLPISQLHPYPSDL